MQNEGIARLGERMKQERLERDWRQDDVHERGGPSDSTQTKLEMGTATSVSLKTLQKIETAFSWAPGSARRVMGGGQPISQPRHSWSDESVRLHLEQPATNEGAGVVPSGEGAYVAAPGAVAEQGVSNAEVLAVLQAMKADIAAMNDKIDRQGERLDRMEGTRGT